MNIYRHKQVDSGFGFTCDEDVLEIIKTVWKIGFKTVGSCQALENYPANQTERYIGVEHDDGVMLFYLAKFLNDSFSGDGYQNSLWLGQTLHFQGPHTWLALLFRDDRDQDLIKALNDFSVQQLFANGV